jgi:hypothetical protein
VGDGSFFSVQNQKPRLPSLLGRKLGDEPVRKRIVKLIYVHFRKKRFKTTVRTNDTCNIVTMGEKIVRFRIWMNMSPGSFQVKPSLDETSIRSPTTTRMGPLTMKNLPMVVNGWRMANSHFHKKSS